jgi:YaiO family outer membrane protein
VACPVAPAGRLLAVPCLAVLLLSNPAQGQEASPWSATLAAERAAVSSAGVESTWSTQQLLLSWRQDAVGGWQAAIERYQRGIATDLSLSARGYKREGDWTFSGGVARSGAPHFLYRYLAEAELSRRLAGTLVAGGGYRVLWFPAVEVRQLQPTLTWYHRRGDIGARLYRTSNAMRDDAAHALLIHATHDLTARLRLSGGASFGTRIFDVAALPSASADSRVGFVLVRVRITARDFLETGVTSARERPDFSYRSVIATYRRVF